MKEIDKGTRLLNYMIDLPLITLIWIPLVLILRAFEYDILIFYLITFTYYFIFELTTSQTVGKMITKTKVIHKNGGKPGIFKILLRSFWRLIPFDLYSYLFGSEIGMHDVLSSTKLVKI